MTDRQAGPAGLFERRLRPLLPGVLIAGIIALASQFVAEHYGAPAMLLALLFGISLNFLGTEAQSKRGIDFGLAVSRLFGFRFRFAFLSAGAVAICGASAAMAIAAILPRDARSEERLIFTVVSVTLLSTLAMIVYPVLAAAIGFDDRTTGIFIGATVHDVAQVVGAGFSVSEETGNVATLVKLLRVVMLAPVVVIAALAIRSFANGGEIDGRRPPLVPVFVLGFVVLAALRSAGLVPELLVQVASEASRWLLVIAIAAVGLKTQPRDILKVGLPAVALLVAETAFLAGLIGLALRFLPHTLLG